MVMGRPTKPKPPSDYADLARNMVGNGKPRLGSRSPVTAGHYQPLPAATIKYTYMKTAFKVIAIATAIIVACLIVHYLSLIHI